MTKKQRKNLIRILISAGLLLGLHFLPVTGVLRLGAYLVPYFIIGCDILAKALKGIRNGRLSDENFLMAVATVGALVLGALDSGDYAEAVAVMLFYQVGELFQSCAVGKSRKSISKLMDIRPDYANIEENGSLIQVDPETVAVGSRIVVQPGEKVPIDAVVVSGTSALNTSALTGESLPRDAGPGDTVLSGCVNMTGVLTLCTIREFGDSTASRILELVENASSRKSRSEAFISKFARVYTPLVCFSALALFVLPTLFSPGSWGIWLYRALSFLVASCPCALVVSIPLTFFAGIGGASREGILVKGSNYLEALSKADCVVFDKTGTLTQGVFAVSGIHHNTLPVQRLLEYAALAESHSSHPIALSLRQAYGAPVDRSRVADIQELGGKGITALVDGSPVALGNQALMEQLEIPCPDTDQSGTHIHIAVDGCYAGLILISDKIKPTAVQAVGAIKKAGIPKVLMLTGDHPAAAQQVADSLGLDGFHAQLLPADKVSIVEQLLPQTSGKLVFVGDGLNDAPVLARADIGIAMGALGSDAAIEAADIVLMDDDPLKIPRAIRISRKCLGIVYQNIFFAIGIKVLALVLVALGFANMWLAIFADVGVMVLAILNATRALFCPNHPTA